MTNKADSGSNSEISLLQSPHDTEDGNVHRWTSLPADVLHHICSFLPEDDVPVLLSVCRPWYICMKEYFTTLTPLYLDECSFRPYSNVRTVIAPLTRTRHTITYEAPLRSIDWLSHCPSLQSLDLTGQDVNALVRSIRSTLHHVPNLRTLSSLNLNESTLNIDFLAQILSNNTHLTHLSLAGVRIPNLPTLSSSTPPSQTPSQVSILLKSLSTLTSLCTLDLSARTSLVRSASPNSNSTPFASFQPTTHCLPLLNQAHSLAPLTALTSLSLTHNRIARTDLHSIAHLTNLRQLSLSFLINDQRLGLSTQGLALLSPLLSLTSLTLRLHGTSREEGTLAHLPKLVSLSLIGCHNVILALSITALQHLTHLDLSDAGAALSHDLLLHLAATLPCLASLTLNRIRCTSDFELPADSIIRSLASLSPRLASLHLDSTQTHGTGFRALPASAHPPFPTLTSLSLSAESLLRSSYASLALLTSLRSLSLSNYPRHELESATRHNCLTPLSALTLLTSLSLSAPSARPSPLPGHPREPLLPFLRNLTNLVHLTLGPISTRGHVFTYFTPLPLLETLTITGSLHLTDTGLSMIMYCRFPSLRALHLTCLFWLPESTSDANLCNALLQQLPETFPGLVALNLGSMRPANGCALLYTARNCAHLRHLVLQDAGAPFEELRALLEPAENLRTLELVRSKDQQPPAQQQPSAPTAMTERAAYTRYRGQLVQKSVTGRARREPVTAAECAYTQSHLFSLAGSA